MGASSQKKMDPKEKSNYGARQLAARSKARKEGRALLLSQAKKESKDTRAKRREQKFSTSLFGPESLRKGQVKDEDYLGD